MLLKKIRDKNWGLKWNRKLSQIEIDEIMYECKEINPFLQSHGEGFTLIEFWSSEDQIIDLLLNTYPELDIE